MGLKLQTGDSEGINDLRIYVVYMYCRFLILRPQIYCFWCEFPHFLPKLFMPLKPCISANLRAVRLKG